MQKNPIIFSRHVGFENIQSMHPFFSKDAFLCKIECYFFRFF